MTGRETEPIELGTNACLRPRAEPVAEDVVGSVPLWDSTFDHRALSSAAAPEDSAPPAPGEAAVWGGVPGWTHQCKWASAPPQPQCPRHAARFIHVLTNLSVPMPDGFPHPLRTRLGRGSAGLCAPPASTLPGSAWARGSLTRLCHHEAGHQEATSTCGLAQTSCRPSGLQQTMAAHCPSFVPALATCP